MPQAKTDPHKFLKKAPKRLAVIDQNACSGCAGAPACIAFCETVTVKQDIVDAIRLVAAPEVNPFELAYVEFDKCIGCALCAQICPWEAITMYTFDESFDILDSVTHKHYEPDEEAA